MRNLPSCEKCFSFAGKQAFLRLREHESREAGRVPPLNRERNNTDASSEFFRTRRTHSCARTRRGPRLENSHGPARGRARAHVDLARSLEEAQRLVIHDRPDLFVLDVDAVPDLGQDFLYDLRTSHPNARAIVLTGVHLAAHREQAAGLGAIHFLEKPFPHADFVDLVQALLSPSGEPDSEKFQGTLSDLHLADIIQLKCMSGSSAALQFTGPQGEKARVYFESGQVRHAIAPGKEGIAAFNEIVNWKGGQISEVSGAAQSPRTIDLDWQILLMEAVRKMDETRDDETPLRRRSGRPAERRKVLVIDDSLMLLSFVKEILAEANYQVVTAATAEEGLVSAAARCARSYPARLRPAGHEGRRSLAGICRKIR